MSTGAGRLNYQSEIGNIKKHFMSKMESLLRFYHYNISVLELFNTLQKNKLCEVFLTTGER